MSLHDGQRVAPVLTYPQDPFRSGFGQFPRDSVYQIGAGTFEIATVVDVFPHARCYRVESAVRGTARGYLLSQTSGNTAYGTNDVGTLQVGTVVLAYYPWQEGHRCMIVGALPNPTWGGELGIPPVIIPGSDVGETEPPFQHMLGGEEGSDNDLGIEDFSSGAPTDSLPGDWGFLNEFGMGLMISKVAAFVRASDNCGVFLFYLDQLLRVHAYNYEHFTASTEHRLYNDEQEVHDVHYRTKFPWEALGLVEQGDEAFIEEAGGWESGQTAAYYEPVEEDQTGAWRDIELRGYLGDLYKAIVAIPDDASGPMTYGRNEDTAYAGLSEITRAANGSIGIRSAKEIILSKAVAIPVPQQKRLPDDNESGDWRKNYRASNALGDGPAVDDMEDFTWPEDQADIKTALLLEYTTWMFNFNRVENLLAHAEDWKIPEETESISRWTIERSYIDPEKVTVLDQQYWADMPELLAIDIDSRVKGQSYYESMSAFAMLDDGSVVIEDGWGSSIVLSRGNIQISCAGDVLMRPGRSFCAFAPKDVVMRAGGSADITATTKDLRLKAERNLQILAGNDAEGSDSEGGILLESRSQGMTLAFDEAGEKVVSGGIVFKCKNSDLVSWSNNLYLGTKQLDDRAAGEIMISADEGRQNLLLQGSTILRDIGQMALDRFNDTQYNMYTDTTTILDTGRLIVRGDTLLTNRGNFYAEGGMAIGGSLTAEGSGAFGGGLSDGAREPHMLAGNDGSPRGQVTPSLDQADQSARSAIASVAPRVDQTEARFQGGESLIGDASTAQKVTFSLRTDDDYGARDFTLFAARWQQLLSANGSGNVWKERAVEAGTVTTYPYPGRLKYESGQALYARLNSKYFDLSTGHAAPRGQDGQTYADRAPEDQGTPTTLNEYVTTIEVE